MYACAPATSRVVMKCDISAIWVFVPRARRYENLVGSMCRSTVCIIQLYTAISIALTNVWISEIGHLDSLRCGFLSGLSSSAIRTLRQLPRAYHRVGQ